MADSKLAMHVRWAARQVENSTSLKVHAQAGHEIEVVWDIPYYHPADYFGGVLRVRTDMGKMGEGGDTGNTYFCRTCGYRDLGFPDVEVDYA